MARLLFVVSFLCILLPTPATAAELTEDVIEQRLMSYCTDSRMKRRRYQNYCKKVWEKHSKEYCEFAGTRSEFGKAFSTFCPEGKTPESPEASQKPEKTPEAAEEQMWQAIKGTNDAASFRLFLSEFPDGKYHGLAKLKLMKLENAAKPSTATTGAPLQDKRIQPVKRLTPLPVKKSNATSSILVLDSKPTGAQVFEDGVLVGTTPYQKLDIKSGSQATFTLKKENYFDQTVELSLQPGVNEFPPVSLKSVYGSLEITSQPEGADVYIAGELKGKTPYEAKQIREGTYAVSVRKSLFSPVENHRLTITAGEQTVKTFTLSPNAGVISISSNPSDAAVAVRNEKDELVAETSTPAEIKLEPGAYRVSIKKETHETLEYKVEVAKDRTLEITAEQASLRRLEGVVNISSNPFRRDAVVYVDNDRMGTIPIQTSLTAGTHEIRVETDDLLAAKTVEVLDGQSVSVLLDLARKTASLNIETNIDDPVIEINSTNARYHNLNAMQPGQYRVYVSDSKDEYYSEQDWVTLEPAEEKTVRVNLQKRFQCIGKFSSPGYLLYLTGATGVLFSMSPVLGAGMGILTGMIGSATYSSCARKKPLTRDDTERFTVVGETHY